MLLQSEEEAEAGIGLFPTLLKMLPYYLNLLVVLAVVSIPEGLPLTIGVSLAFSVMSMFKDRILIRQLDAPEKMGGVDEILCGKTGTITEGQMRVSQFHCESRKIKNSRKDTFLNCELHPETVERVKDCIMYNSEAKVEMTATHYVPVGNGTDSCLLRFLQDADVPIHLLVNRKLGRVRAQSPFSSEKKRSAIALLHPDRPDTVSIYVKGAPEVVMALCQYM
mmetsp:Transcript_18407/g.28237  ORF Transcript_18407/g.28237 Transcript_18407/m.28237 type:complete len:222 (+) Transcript_18407:995-1660(+)